MEEVFQDRKVNKDIFLEIFIHKEVFRVKDNSDHKEVNVVMEDNIVIKEANIFRVLS